MENTHKKQTKILSTEYEKVKKKSEEYEEVIDNKKKVITEFGAQIKKSPK